MICFALFLPLGLPFGFQDHVTRTQEFDVAGLRRNLLENSDAHSPNFSYPTFVWQFLDEDSYDWEDRDFSKTQPQLEFDIGVPRFDKATKDTWEEALIEFLPRPVPPLEIDEFTPGALTVEAPPASLSRVGRVLDELFACSERTATVACYRLSSLPEGHLESPVFDATTTERWLREGGGSLAARERGRLGQRMALRQLKARILIASTSNDSTWQEDGDYSYEFTDERAPLRQGVDFAARVLPSPTGRFLLRVQGRWGHEASFGVHELTLPGGELRWLDTVGMRSQRLDSTAQLLPGESLLLGSSQEPSGLWLFVLEDAPENAASFTVGEAEYLATGAICRSLQPLHFEIPLGPPTRLGFGQSWPYDENHVTVNGSGASPALMRRDHLNELLSPLGSGAQVSSLLPWFEDSVRLPRGTPDAAEAATLLRKLAAQTDRTVAIEIRFGELEIDDAASFLSRNREEAVKELPHRAWASTRLGSRLGMSSGWVQSLLTDVITDFSNTIFPGNPAHFALLDGFVLRCFVEQTRAGELHARTQFALQRIVDLSLRLPLANGDVPSTGAPPTELPLPRTAVARLDASVCGQPGEWLLVGSSQMEGQGKTLVACIRFLL